jgi:hypothetical protein
LGGGLDVAIARYTAAALATPPRALGAGGARSGGIEGSSIRGAGAGSSGGGSAARGAGATCRGGSDASGGNDLGGGGALLRGGGGGVRDGGDGAAATGGGLLWRAGGSGAAEGADFATSSSFGCSGSANDSNVTTGIVAGTSSSSASAELGPMPRKVRRRSRAGVRTGSAWMRSKSSSGSVSAETKLSSRTVSGALSFEVAIFDFLQSRLVSHGQRFLPAESHARAVSMTHGNENAGDRMRECPGIAGTAQGAVEPTLQLVARS